MKTEIALNGGQVAAAVTTMMLAACADADISDAEVERLRETLVSQTPWAKGMTPEAVAELLEKARGRVHDICQLMNNQAALDQAIRALGDELGSSAARETVLALSRDVAAADGLDDDERIGIEMLAAAFGVK